METPKGFIQAKARQCGRGINQPFRIAFNLPDGEVIRLAVADDDAIWLQEAISEFIALRKLVPKKKSRPECLGLPDRI